MPDEMNVLEPLTIQSASSPEPSRTAEVRMPARSLPAPGSVIATAMIVSPLVMPGSQRFFCSSLVRSLKYGPTTSLCRLSAGPGTPALAISSSMIALNRKSSLPPPPNSSGMLNPMSPCLPAGDVGRPVDDPVGLPLLRVGDEFAVDVAADGIAERLVLGVVNRSLHRHPFAYLAFHTG